MLCRPKSKTTIDQAVEILSRNGTLKTGATVCTYPNNLGFHEARKVIGDSFGGKTAERGSSILNKFIEPMGLCSDDATQDRQDVNAFAMGFFEYDLLSKGGTIFGLRDKEGVLQAVIVFREYDASARKERHEGLRYKMSSFFMNMRAYFTIRNDSIVGYPELFKDKSKEKEFGKLIKDFDPLVDVMHGWHQEYGPVGRHWYIGVVASNPDGQGKGYCKEALNLLHQAADECNMACYLECETKNRKYYEKFGYNVVPGDGIGTMKIKDITLDGHLMIRSAKSSQHS